jgi:hypothetical protein
MTGLCSSSNRSNPDEKKRKAFRSPALPSAELQLFVKLLMCHQRGVVRVAAGDNGRSVIAEIDILVLRRKGVNIEPVRIQKVSQLICLREIQGLAVTELLAYLKQPFDHFERCETLIWIIESCHRVGLNALRLRSYLRLRRLLKGCSLFIKQNGERMPHIYMM